MNVYFWKDAKGGKFHLYDLTTPSRPTSRPLTPQPTAANMATLFEEVARYPEGLVRYTLLGVAVAPTTGKQDQVVRVGWLRRARDRRGRPRPVHRWRRIPATVCFAAVGVLPALAPSTIVTLAYSSVPAAPPCCSA
jgi:hypothetical protein